MLSINFPRSRIGAANSNPIGMMPARSLSTCSIVPLRCSRSWRVHRGRGACCTATFIITTSSTISTAAGSPSIPRAWSARAPMRLAPRCEIRPRILPFCRGVNHRAADRRRGRALAIRSRPRLGMGVCTSRSVGDLVHSRRSRSEPRLGNCSRHSSLAVAAFFLEPFRSRRARLMLWPNRSSGMHGSRQVR